MAMANCRTCGKLFNRVRDRVCPKCIEEEQELLKKVVTHIRETGVTFIAQIAEETEVDRALILGWVHQGKLELNTGTETVEGGCKRCGKPVDQGELCKSCRGKFAAEIAQQRAATGAEPAPAPAADRHGMHSRN